jgi:hypothetical protein
VTNRVAPRLLAPRSQGEVADSSLGTILTEAAPAAGAADAVGEAFFAMFTAFLLMVPVAWVYYLSRRKRGYQQSLMHTLVILPIVVSGVVIMVQNSIALAFSLGGIVGAIAFRNRLEDTKDAVHVFVAIGVGLACAVQGAAIGLTLSLFYNLVNVALWMGDIGRTPPGLAGPPAQARLDVLQASGGNRSEAFVSQVDTLLLKSMSPNQLDALLKRADKRRRKVVADAADEKPAPAAAKIKRRIRVRVVAPAERLKAQRANAEPVFDRLMKEWRLEKSTTSNGRAILEYQGKIKKSCQPDALAAEVRAALGGGIEKIEVLDA